MVYQQEICPEELRIERNLAAELAKSVGASVSVRSVWGSTINHIDDLPYNPTEYVPWNFTSLKGKHAGIEVKPILPPPTSGSLPFPGDPDAYIQHAAGYLPTLGEFGFPLGVQHDERASLVFRGGESAGLERL